jgi:hypothetical protein
MDKFVSALKDLIGFCSANPDRLIAIFGVLIAVFAWLFPPDFLRRFFHSSMKHEKSKNHQKDSIVFLIRLGEQSGKYWESVSLPQKYPISPIESRCSQSFRISYDNFVDDVDPSFDITLLNQLDSPIIINEIGVEIVCIAHSMMGYGDTQSSKIVQQAIYTIQIPDFKANIAKKLGRERFPRTFEPTDLNLVLPVNYPDVFSVDPMGTLRYEILLKNYVSNMPNFSVIKFWVTTQSGKYSSNLVHVFTL